MKKRKLKPSWRRKPDNVITLVPLSKEISVATGFKEDDIRLVINSMILKIEKHMLEGSSIRLPGLGLMYPTIRTARAAMNLNGGKGKPEVMRIPATWRMKFRESSTIAKKLADKAIFQHEIDNLYES